MKPTLLIAWREYKQYVFSRGFLLFLILLPVAVFFGGAAMTFVEAAKPVREFTVVDPSGRFAPVIDRALSESHQRAVLSTWNVYLEALVDRTIIEPEDIEPPFNSAPVTAARIMAFEEAGGIAAAQRAVRPYLKTDVPFPSPRRTFRRLDLPAEIARTATPAEAADLLRPYLLGERPFPGAGEQGLFAALIIPPDYGVSADEPSAEYWSRNLTDPALQAALSSALRSALLGEAAKTYGLDEPQLQTLLDLDAPVAAFRPDRAVEEAELDTIDRLETAVLPAVLTYMLLSIIFGVGNLLLTNTIEERSNKIVEVLLSSVTADELMTGKLVGIAAVGLTLPAIFFIAGLASMLLNASDGGFAQELMTTLLSSNLVPIYIFYFLCAYTIFAMIFLAIGAMSNSLQDAQTFMGPVILLVFLPVPFMMLVFQNPNGLAATILTWIPIYTPYAVMMRAAADPPLFEILGATAVMLIFGFFLARIMGRIFKNALLQAAPPRAREIWRLAKAR